MKRKILLASALAATAGLTWTGTASAVEIDPVVRAPQAEIDPVVRAPEAARDGLVIILDVEAQF